jgi:LPXTG-site transpeptidase (sortase) family protein
MKGIVETIVWLMQASERVYARKWSFLGLFAVAFFGSLAILAELDLLPEAPEAAQVSLETDQVAGAGAGMTQAAESPTKVEIPKIKLTALIENPATTAVEALDAELLKGAVRYPTSAKLGEDGNVVLFGHSSYLPIVNNQAYKTFNDIQKLAKGDSITVYSSGTAYTYRVKSVAKERADENTAIPLSVGGKMLTLVTCNSFGTKQDRFVVVADFVESHSLGA